MSALDEGFDAFQRAARTDGAPVTKAGERRFREIFAVASRALRRDRQVWETEGQEILDWCAYQGRAAALLVRISGRKSIGAQHVDAAVQIVADWKPQARTSLCH